MTNLTTEKGYCMGTLLGGLLKLQAVERQLAQVRGRKRTRLNIIRVQEGKVELLRKEQDQLHQRILSRRKDSDQLTLDLKTREDHVSKLRTSLNSAKTNKEYAAILTQLNGMKADNAKIEEQALIVMQDAEAVVGEEAKSQERIAQEQARLEEMKKFTSDELARLETMIESLSAQRAEAAKDVPATALTAFERIAGNYDGEGMANIEIRGNKPPYDYVCGGCYMSLNAEHVNALRTRDEIRTCDNCQRILYLKEDGK
ncbi:MAG: C4-type zinc ribbon domain-containing protein [Planctomycetota bacterium]|nr:C4-type zinc ribbon domain-containing protein [Planctomycetota bacterium]